MWSCTSLLLSGLLLPSKNWCSNEDVDKFQKYFGDEYEVNVYACTTMTREYSDPWTENIFVVSR